MEKIFLSLKSKGFTVVILTILLVFPFYQSILLLTNPQKTWLPESERTGYLEMWTAGYGIKETAEYLKEVAQSNKVLVGTEGFFGTLPDGLQIYLEKIPNITVIGVGQPIREISPKLTSGLVDNRVFLLVNDTRMEIKDENKLKLIAKYPKAINPKTGLQESLLLLEILK